MPNTTMKPMKLRGWAKALPMPPSMAGAMNRVLPQPIRNWLRYSCAGRVWLVACASMNAPVAISATATISCCVKLDGASVRTLAAMPHTQPSTTAADRPCSWALSRPSCWNRATAPTLCSDRQTRISTMDRVRRSRSPLASQRRLSIGLRRWCSTSPAATSSATAAASSTPSQAASVHHSTGPKARTTARQPVPAAKLAMVARSSGSNTR